MTTEFDPHPIIRELASAEWPCPIVPEDVELGHSAECLCGGTDRIVPFASLMVHIRSDWMLREDIKATMEDVRRGWIPEPNQKAAMWIILQALPKEVQLVIIQRGLDQQTCLIEAQQWLESML